MLVQLGKEGVTDSRGNEDEDEHRVWKWVETPSLLHYPENHGTPENVTYWRWSRFSRDEGGCGFASLIGLADVFPTTAGEGFGGAEDEHGGLPAGLLG